MYGTFALHKAVNEFVKLMVECLSHLQFCLFLKIVLIVRFIVVYLIIQGHSGLNDALDALETNQFFCGQYENQRDGA